jgi:amino acid adenylation domain-containing protein/thioester reductase-like protein
MNQQNLQYALSHPQQRIWYAEMLHPGTGMWNNAGTLKIRGRLDFALLETAVNIMLRDYETLRIRIGQKEGVPYQYVADYAPQTVDLIDFSERGVEKLYEWDSIQTQTPMPLIDSNLFYFAFLRLGEEEGGIYAKLHHIISDGLSIVEFSNRLMGVYQNLLNGEEPQHPAVRSYIDYLSEEQKYLDSKRFSYDREYWTGLFDQLPEPTVIKQKKTSYYGLKAKRRTYLIRPRLSKQIRDYCEQTGVTVYSLFLSALAIYINRITTKKDLVIGAPVANRTTAKAKDMFGMFVSTVPIRIQIEDEMSFKNFAQEVSGSWFSALKHQKYPYNLLMQDLRGTHKGLESLYDVTLSYQIGKFEKTADAFTYEGRWHFSGYQEPSLAIHVNDREDEGRFVVDYDHHTPLFSVKEIEFIHAHLMNIIRDGIIRPDTSLYMLDLMSDDEYERVVYQFNATERVFPQGETLVDLWNKRMAQTDGSDVALICRGESMTYRQLDERSSAMARYLRDLGVGAESSVGLLVKRTMDYPVGVLAILKAGGTFVPIDADLPCERLAYILRDSDAKVLLISPDLRDKYTVDENITVIPTDIALEPASCPTPVCTPKHLAYMIYTSGSTGQPKGVQIEHRSIVHFVYSMLHIWDFKPGARMLGSSSISFDVSLMEMLPTLMSGNTLVIAQEHELSIPRNLVELIQSAGVNMMAVTPGRMELLLSDKQGPASLRNFREVGMGGDAVNEQLLAQVQQATNARISDYYGPTEITIICTISDLTNAKAPNIGRPMHNVKAYILDEHRNPVPIGVPGELCIGGPGLARGYTGKPEMTAERFVDNPFRPGEKIYRTGDLVRWYPLGEIEFLGRIDQQVKIRGFRIELAEVESRLMQAPGVTACAVAAREDAEGRKYLCAYLVGNPPPRAELKAHLLRDLPAYMVPSWFVTVDSLPYNTSGKVARRLLPDPLLTREALIDDYVPPETATEARLANIWSGVLNVKTIGRNDSFFDIGGDSLSIVRVLAQVQLRFSVEIHLEDVNRSPYLKDFAALIDAAEAQDYRPIRPIPEQEYYPVSSAQQRMWVLSQAESSVTYNMPAVFVLPDEPDAARLAAAFDALVERHEVLRTRFVLKGGELRQRLEKRVPLKLEQLSCEPRRLNAVLKSLVRPFDMGKAPLMRTALIDAGTKHVLYVDTHHSICDGRSAQVLMADLAALYAGKTLPPLTVQYKDYAVWQREFMMTDAMERQREFWKAELAGELPLLNLHTDKPRPPQQRFEGARYGFALSPQTTEALRMFAAQRGGTLFMAMLAIFNVLLSRYTGQEDIIVGTPVAGRTRPELQDMTGVFINTVPLRNYPNGNRSFAEFFDELSQNVFAALAHADYPFEHIVADLKLPRDLSRNPVFDTMLIQLKGDGAPPIPGALPYPFDAGVSKLDLTLEVLERDGLSCQFEYNTRLFRKTKIMRMAAHFCRLAELLAAEPDTRLQDAPMLTQEELWEVTQGFNQTDLPLDRERTIQSIFEETAERFADKTAVISEGVSLTFRELNERANRFAYLLREKGVGRNTVVALCMRRCTDLMAALFGVLKAGGAYLPLDVAYPVDRLAFMLSDSGAKILLTDGSVDVPFEGEALHVKDVPNCGLSDNLLPIDRPEDTAYVIYTSGSTGLPKGAVLHRRGLLNFYEGVKDVVDYDPAQTSASVTTVSFDIFVCDALLPLLYGSTLVLCTEEELRQAHLLAALIDKHDVKFIQFTPARMRVMMESAAFREAMARHIEKIMLGGEPIPESLLRLLKKYFSARIVNAYGPTEATVYSSFMDLTNTNHVTIGHPICNMRMYVLDKNRRPVPVGVLGEGYISGVGVAAGYLNREELNRKTFLPDPFWPGHTMYKTGDVCVFLEDGDVEMCGRVDHQIKIRGLRIELGEIEAAMRQFKGIEEAVVKDWGEGAAKYLCGYYAMSEPVSEEALRAHLSKKLPAYMVPSWFVGMPELPTTLNGKVDRKMLKEPDRSNASGKSTSKSKLTATEKKMARVWSRILRTEGIGPDDNFFALGGDSLGVIKVQAAVLQYGWAIRTRDFYEQQTLRKICQRLGKTEAEEPRSEAVYQRIESMRGMPVPDYPHLKPPAMKRVLLTGATGYLGAQLVAELAEMPDTQILCVVRGNSDAECRRHIKDVLAFYFGDCPNIIKKVTALRGDISHERLGLSGNDWGKAMTADTIVHCGAITDHVGSAEMFDRVNVDGTQNVISLAKASGAALLHISTESVSGTAFPDDADRAGVFTERDFYIGQNYADNEYVRSKFLAELLVLDALAEGVNARIYRVGMLTATMDGRFQLRTEKNAFGNRLKAIRELGVVPLSMLGMQVEMTPADTCARAIIALSLISDGILPIYNVYNTNLLTGGELVSLMEACGFRIKVISDQEFASEMNDLSRQGRLELLTSLMEELDPGHRPPAIAITAALTTDRLKQIGFDWPVIDEAYLSRFMQVIAGEIEGRSGEI